MAEVSFRPEVERAAHLIRSYDILDFDIAAKRCREEGINEEDIEAGRALAEERRRVWHRDVAVFGDPAYGGGRW